MSQVMLLILVIFIAGLVFLGYINRPHKASTVPPESVAASAQLAKDLSGTAIPEYVLTYGTTCPVIYIWMYYNN
jgi:hypothetical protein